MFKDSQQTRKALAIGLNYKHSAVSPLNGCINDTKTIEEFLKNNHFNDEDIEKSVSNTVLKITLSPKK